ncbi:MAG: hypothetical protein ACLUG1_04280 [Christensenellales bacterium]
MRGKENGALSLPASSASMTICICSVSFSSSSAGRRSFTSSSRSRIFMRWRKILQSQPNVLTSFSIKSTIADSEKDGLST